MGVPAFFRWLSRKYPSVIVECVEQKPTDVDGQLIYIDSSLPNPNGVEFDNLYLDMNGIIHPCTHPEDKPPPKDEDEMMVAIFECIDRLFRIVRPRKLLYMAIDGVAPRAKMNQQRSRRFRASKETQEKIDEIARIRDELLAKGAYLPPERPKEAHFDSNCITPGTPFMDRLSKCLHYYIHDSRQCGRQSACNFFSDDGWITDSGDVKLERVQVIMTELGHMEDEIFKRRHQNEINFKAKDKARKRQQQRINFEMLEKTQFAPMPIGQNAKPLENVRQEAANMRVAGMQNEAAQEQDSRGRKRSAQAAGLDDEDDDDKNDEVRLWEQGFKERYYESKFEVARDNLEFRYRVALQYVRGLCWVLRYYYQGCASWKWYFPYHYAPFASDFVNICGLSTKFEEGTQPFRPLEQLMGVFPAASSTHVPKPWAKLMSDPFSSIIDFYPIDFKIDLNGKKFAWQGVALLPFVDEERLFKALEPYYGELTEAEKQRNIRGHDRLYVGTANKSYDYLLGLYSEAGSKLRSLIEKQQKYPYISDGVTGEVMLSKDCVVIGGQLPSPVIGLQPVLGNHVVCVRFLDPSYDKEFPARRLEGAVQPPRVLKPGHLGHEENRNYRPQIGMVRSNTIATMEAAGRRMLGHHLPRQTPYGSVPPPPQHAGHHNRSQSYGPRPSGYVPYQNNQEHGRSFSSGGQEQGRGYNNHSHGPRTYNQGNQDYSQNNRGYSQNQGYSQSNQGPSRSGYGYGNQNRFGNSGGSGYRSQSGGYESQGHQKYGGHQTSQPTQGYSSSSGKYGQSQGYSTQGSRDARNRYNSDQPQSGSNRRYQGSSQGGSWR
ncbi:hypothetical protein B5X24_HaOG204131 [Helicoverpa armigera]|uniref:5'-3' exoribonuclease n=1 Tax=Helicoverpa armigera TaxID=29058 RepID=A0A2W1BT41_HELAM|nr:hypothetical protein B5X24_HaOG204131 [Helicoverpa armigera]